jgi:hypothetical protein
MRRIIYYIWSAFGLSCIYALFVSDAHRIISEEGLYYIDNQEKK